MPQLPELPPVRGIDRSFHSSLRRKVSHNALVSPQFGNIWKCEIKSTQIRPNPQREGTGSEMLPRSSALVNVYKIRNATSHRTLSWTSWTWCIAIPSNICLQLRNYDRTRCQDVACRGYGAHIMIAINLRMSTRCIADKPV